MKWGSDIRRDWAARANRENGHHTQHHQRTGKHPSCFLNKICGTCGTKQLLRLAAEGRVNATAFRVLDQNGAHEKDANNGNEYRECR